MIMNFVWSRYLFEYLLILISCTCVNSILALPMITSPTHSIINGTMTVIVAEGSNVTLRCEAAGDGKLEYRWRRVSRSIPGTANGDKNQTLTFTNIRFGNSGKYFCEVKIKGNLQSSKDVQVTVRRRPSVTSIPSNQELSIVSGNEEVMLTCTVTGDNITGVYWKRTDGSQHSNMSSLSNDNRTLTITISEARPTHSGRYRCVVYSQWGVAQSRNVQVTISIAPPMITTQPTDQMITALQDVTFTCEAKGFEVEYEWKRHNGSVTNGRQSSLTISRATPLDEDQYYCVAMTEGGYAFSNNVTLTVNDTITIIQSPQSVTVAVGNMLNLSITVKGAGNLMYQWKKEDSKSLSNAATGERSSNLIVRSVTTSDNGSYYCVVMNEWGNMVKSDKAIVKVLQITTDPQDKVVAFGSTKVTLMCTSSLSSDVIFSWMHNGTTIHGWSTTGDTSILTITNVQYNDAGSYACTVRSGSVSVMSNTTTLTVYGSPTIMTHPASQLINTSISVILNCEGTGGGSITYRWESKKSNNKWMNISNSDSSTLAVGTLKRSQQYRCVVSNQAGSTRSNVSTVTVLSITNQPMNYTVIALNDATLRCTTAVDNVKYSWHRANGVMPSGSIGLNKSTLTIPRAIPPDMGVYYCIISKDRVTVESDRATLDVNDLLFVNITPTNNTIGERGMAKFIATASGINMNNFTYQWKKKGISKLPNKVSDVGGISLTIPYLSKLDEGQYYCIVTNEWSRSVESNYVKLTVEAGLPLIQRHPQNQFVNNSQKATFECFVNGSNSTLKIIWQRNKKRYNSKNLKNTVLSDGARSILTIENATTNNDGNYRCRATNVDKKNAFSNEAELIIIPKINENPNDVTVFIGQSSELTCRALGTDVIYQWTKNNISIHDTNSRILRITNITESDEGVYKCVASNKGGRVESNPAIVTVYGPPMIKKLPKQLHAVLGEGFNITCTATNDHDAPMNLTLSWTAPNKVDIMTTDKYDGVSAISTLHISDVTHDHDGLYVCTASNGEHQGNNVLVTLTLVVEEKSSPPTNFTIININATSFQLMWSLPKIPHGTINYYNVYYSKSSHNQFVKVLNDAKFDGTYILTNLSPYTVYTVYVTAVRLIAGDSDEPLEGITSLRLRERTLAGEPIITDSGVNQIMSQVILNINNSATSTGNMFEVDLPQISMRNGPFSHLYIIVIVNSSAVNATVLSTLKLLNHSMGNPMLLYIAAVVNASQYMQYADDYRIRYALGAGDNTTDANGRMFHNREVKREYSFFYRVFSVNSTLGNEIYTDTEIKPVARPQQSTGGSSSSSSGSAIGPIIGVIVALLLIIAVIVVVILLLFCYKNKHLEPKKVGLSDVVPTDVPLSNKEMKDEDTKLLAATSPFPQETSFSPNSPLPMEVTTSVGQPTTLFIELPYADDSEITWQKDRKLVSHPVLPDGSLYIANTKLTDQGDYIVTAAATDSTTSESLKLIVIDPKMPTTLSDHKPVKVEDFPEHIALMQSKKSIQFEEDYESVMVDVSTSQHAAKLHVNASKNRYKNIIPYDHSRVVLTQQGEKPGSDYINASFVDGYKEPKAYIASQGPVTNTVDDFWRMIWECNVTTIVMLTRLVEDSKIKCHQYWPENEFAEHGDFKVTIIKHEAIAKYCIRQFVIEKTSDHKSREVCQFHYTAWPDHGVPKYGTDILEFQKRIDKHHKRKDNKPMLVHCSAGVGRTGTFIAIDIEIQRINHESLVDPFNCVCRLRFWRNHMVQTVDQYTLIFTALLEYIACGDTSIAAPTKSVREKVRELSTVDPSTKKTGFETQFETLAKNSPKEKEFSFTFATSKNKSKNRNKKSMPPDASRVHLSKAGSKSDYINACYIDGYRHCKEFLVGPGPMESTSGDFWRMIWENQSHAIVMLGQLKENGDEASCQYWPKKDEKCEFDNLTVHTTSEDPMDNNVMKRVMKITHKETSATKTITQLQYVEWSQNVTPSNANSIIDMIETLERIQRKTGNGPITVHCSDGMGRSGTFCALVVSMNRFKAEQMVDVFKTIITMRTQRPGLVANAEQYKFIHEAITTMLQRFVNYSNFSFDDMTASAVYENLPTSST